MAERMLKTAYLSGQMTGRVWEEICAERNHARELLEAIGIEVFDPIRGKDLRDDHKLGANNEGTAPDKCIVQRDLMDVERADVTIVLTGDSYRMTGTLFEWAWAYFLRKPVFVVSKTAAEELGMWRRVPSTAIFSSIEELVRHLEKFWT